MPHDPALAVRMAAFAIAMRAKAGGLDADDVDALRAQAERALGRDDPMRRAVTAFVVQYEISRGNARALAELGGNLSDSIAALNMPVPPGLDRSDING